MQFFLSFVAPQDAAMHVYVARKNYSPLTGRGSLDLGSHAASLVDSNNADGINQSIFHLLHMTFAHAIAHKCDV